MLILPAIDLRHGNCVRLYQGKPEHETVYSNDPVEVAYAWKSKGAEMLHIVDLDGAFQGKPVHLQLIGSIRKQVGIPVEVGGGFRDLPAIEQAANQGIDRIILGTTAIYRPDLVDQAVRRFGSKIAVSIDVAGSFAAAAGWQEVSTVSYNDLVARMRGLGVTELLFTDTRRDGTLLGPDLDAIRSFLAVAMMPVTIAGGIVSLDDIRHLKVLEPEGVRGVVIGKALYDKKIELEDALRAAQ